MPEATDVSPVGSGEFADLMTRIGPFERDPAIAVACSGGADSMALTVLLQDWVRARGGSLTALIVDHAIRPESATEARRVSGWLAARKIDHEVLAWRGAPIASGVQAAARTARYALLSAWCEARDCLHLAVAHHLEDQAETVLLRLARGSGVDGLSAMAPVTESRALRIVRPLLSMPRARLRETLKALDLDHVEDPSNRNDTFARVRMRMLVPALDDEGMTPLRLAATAAHMARVRESLDDATAGLLARTFVLYDAGYGILNPRKLIAAPREIGLRALAGILTCIGGGGYAPRFDRLERLYDMIDTIPGGGGRTLAGCRVLGRRAGVLVCREVAAIRAAVQPASGPVFWDNRFRMDFAEGGSAVVMALGRDGWLDIASVAPELKHSQIPAAVRPTLPAIWENKRVLAVPHLGFIRPGRGPAVPVPEKMRFAPLRPLVSPRFTLH
ncbi:MAG: tRNA lysidine(34) synthetase TilS [Alphaproteobacteria bacterium]